MARCHIRKNGPGCALMVWIRTIRPAIRVLDPVISYEGLIILKQPDKSRLAGRNRSLSPIEAGQGDDDKYGGDADIKSHIDLF